MWEWNEAIIFAGLAPSRGARGGSWASSEANLRASFRTGGYDPSVENSVLGFRVARSYAIPEPSTFGVAGLGLLSLCIIGRRRRRC